MNRLIHNRTLGFFISLALILGAATSCFKKPVELAPEVAAGGTSDEGLYKLGEAYIKRDEEKALLYLRQVIDSFPKSFYAQRAKLLIADSYFRKGDEANMILAAAEYREFISLYPYSPSAAYCQFQIAMTYYKKALKPGRDQAKTIQALAEFKKVMTNYPQSEQTKQAEEKIRDCEERLAEHQLHIGKQYHKQQAFKAATGRLTELLTNYPGFSKMDQVYFYMADSYFRWNKADEAVPFFTKLISDYPKSKFVKKAQARLREIEKKPAEKK